MNYLSIITKDFKAVFGYETKKERQELEKKYPNGEYKVFPNNQKQEAIKYTGVKDIANKKQWIVNDVKIVKQNNENQNIINKDNENQNNTLASLINHYKNNNVSAVKLHLNKEEFVTVILNPMYILKSQIKINNYKLYSEAGSFDFVNAESHLFSLKKFINETKNQNNEYYSLKEGLSLIFEDNDFYTVLQPTNLTFFDGYILFDYVFNFSVEYGRSSSYNDYICKISKSNEKILYTINMNKVIKIEPILNIWEIKDKDVLNIIKK